MTSYSGPNLIITPARPARLPRRGTPVTGRRWAQSARPAAHTDHTNESDPIDRYRYRYRMVGANGSRSREQTPTPASPTGRAQGPLEQSTRTQRYPLARNPALQVTCHNDCTPRSVASKRNPGIRNLGGKCPPSRRASPTPSASTADTYYTSTSRRGFHGGGPCAGSSRP